MLGDEIAASTLTTLSLRNSRDTAKGARRSVPCPVRTLHPLGNVWGGGDRSSRPAQLQARENEQKALSLWIKGATYQQIAAAGFGVASASGAWRSVSRALARIPKAEADQARQAQLARLQAIRMMVWPRWTKRRSDGLL